MLNGMVQRAERARADRLIRGQVERIEAYLDSITPTPELPGAPVLVFNASTRIQSLSLNAAFSLLASWSMRSAGVPVRYLVCREGMLQCMLGTQWSNLDQPPPCKECIRFGEKILPSRLSTSMRLNRGLIRRLELELEARSLDELSDWRFEDLPIGELCLPTVRWALRRHDLYDDRAARGLFRQYLLSAASLAEWFRSTFAELEPRALVVFNGITYPEAVARAMALRLGIPVTTHEVGLRALSAFFSHEHATFREVDLPEESSLEPDWSQVLDAYLEDRGQGRFSMAGVRFWPEIEPIPAKLKVSMQAYRQEIPIFTNVIFDTSQVHANSIFEHMFEWLDAVGELTADYPETLFVIRAHPDENRPGKESRQTVADWFESSGLLDQPNVTFIGPDERVSSYELIERSSFVLVYNSSVGLEASIQGKAVLCAGRARYTQANTVFMPSDKAEYFRQLESMLESSSIEAPPEFAENGRRFLYQELFRSSIDLSDFLIPYPSLPGMVLLRDFEPQALKEHPALEAIRRGVLDGATFATEPRVSTS
ncbi:MAG: hypothetical protein BMS9Abin28_2184 [Anaerolineae bacterium]|nr:MAG: hypothetical protein BMS9Abin28_2184 [Anaerolineae bacterium]